MKRVILHKLSSSDVTLVQNRFIDEYMKDANDAQLKVYLYLIRMLNANQAISVSDIADKFNHTEKDVMRSLKYWEKQKLLTLDYDDDKNLSGIHLCDLSTDHSPAASEQAIQTVQTLAPIRSLPASTAEPETEIAPSPYEKPVYSLDQLKEFKSRESTSQLLYVAEMYIGKPLTPSEIKSILGCTWFLFRFDRLPDPVLRRPRQKGFQIYRQGCCQLGGRRSHYPEAGPAPCQ